MKRSLPPPETRVPPPPNTPPEDTKVPPKPKKDLTPGALIRGLVNSLPPSVKSNAKKIGENIKDQVVGTASGAANAVSNATSAASKAANDYASSNFGRGQYNKYAKEATDKQAKENAQHNRDGNPHKVKPQVRPSYKEFVQSKAGKVAADTVNSLFGTKDNKEGKPSSKKPRGISEEEMKRRREKIQEQANERRARGYNS